MTKVVGDTKIAIQSKIATQKFPSASTNDKDENEIVESMSWHFEEWMEDRALQPVHALWTWINYLFRIL